MSIEICNVGTFEVKSDKLIVTDPCYDTDSIGRINGVIENPLQGTWCAVIEMTNDTGGWGNRVARLSVYHQDHREAFPCETVNFPVFVDSGQAGIFDFALYPKSDEDRGEYGDLTKFYGQVCEITLEEDGGCVSFGAASRSGYGDGSYRCFVSRKDGMVVAAEIVFIDDEEEEDFEEDEYDDEEE